MDLENFELLAELMEATGPSGHENDVQAIVHRELREIADEITVDPIGNLVGTVHGERDCSVGIVAHADEWGWMVSGITDGGFLELTTIGGTNPMTPVSQRVSVRTDDGILEGVVGTIPPHKLTDEHLDLRPDDGAKFYKANDVHVDLGLPRADVERTVSVGDVVTLRQETSVIGNLVSGKAIDDRGLLFAMLEAARRVEQPAPTVHLVSSTQEEFGDDHHLRGATAIASELDVDVWIALDITAADDQPFFEGDPAFTLGGGAGIKLMDRITIPSPLVNRRLRELADREGIPYQLEVTDHVTTDAGALQNVDGGKPTGAILLPARNAHSTTEMAHVEDVEAVIDLLATFVREETGREYVPSFG